MFATLNPQAVAVFFLRRLRMWTVRGSLKPNTSGPEMREPGEGPSMQAFVHGCVADGPSNLLLHKRW
jgi:hypothetical protein